MFAPIKNYDQVDFLKKNPIVRFDTIYENASFVPFAMFSASMDPDDSHYFDVRSFVMDETEFELFTLRMQRRSTLNVPVDVRYGDQILLLVTCSYNDSDGRYILALRQLRPGESEEDIRALVTQAK